MAKRHAEKRRTSTCQFADRVARISVDKYHEISDQLDSKDRFACVATFLAHFRNEGRLVVLAMGVGTKFLTESELEKEMSISNDYGCRVRDCHAEVLARRAFRRQITLEMLDGVRSRNLVSQEARVLDRCDDKNADVIQFKLKEGVTLHMYTSSAPCGNAVLKKFGTMKRERFNEEYGSDEWPVEGHDHVQGHSIRLGQFSLLVKKDSSKKSVEIKESSVQENANLDDRHKGEARSEILEPKTSDTKQSKKKKPWPATETDDWCPPGTSITNFGKGSTHTCSDKILRWNALGLQGSLLSSVSEKLLLSSLTVGRKLTQAMCRRAVCCRAGNDQRCQPVGPSSGQGSSLTASVNRSEYPRFSINHPSIMGTSVYLDETGVIDMEDAEKRGKGQDVRFHSNRTWGWWPSINMDEPATTKNEMSRMVELIDGTSGFVESDLLEVQGGTEIESRLCTKSLSSLFLQIHQAVPGPNKVGDKLPSPILLKDLLQFKQTMSPDYEANKKKLMKEHRVFQQWMCRSYRIGSQSQF